MGLDISITHDGNELAYYRKVWPLCTAVSTIARAPETASLVHLKLDTYRIAALAEEFLSHAHDRLHWTTILHVLRDLDRADQILEATPDADIVITCDW